MKLSRSQKALVSTMVAFILEIVNIVSALVVPRTIMAAFGSEANGLLGSIAQFLGYISLLQMGVGGVTRAALYKPLALGDSQQISRVVKAMDQFFAKIGYFSIAYTVILAIVYPYLGNSSFDFSYTASMVGIIALGTIAQYLWGFTYRNLLIADQRGYISSLVTIATTIMNMLVTIVMVHLGASLHVIKLVAATVFVIQPLVLRRICIHHYGIDRNAEPDNVAIKQRWNGFLHSFADFVHRKTDIFILTIAATLKDVSVYSVYSVITNGLNAIIAMVTGPFMSAMGNMLARKEENVVKDTMRIYLFLTHYVSTVIFSVAILMILPFVQIYTKGIQDAEYIQGTFAVLLLMAEMLACLKQPYGSLIGAAGHYKQTRLGPSLEALTNLFISLILVSKYRLVGVAAGTLVGMIVGTIYSVWYVKHNIICMDYKVSIKRYVISGLSIILIWWIGRRVSIPVENAFDWIYKAVVSTVIAITIVSGIHLGFYREDMKKTIMKVLYTMGLSK